MSLIARRAFTFRLPFFHIRAHIKSACLWETQLLKMASRPPNGTELREQAHSSMSCSIQLGFGCMPLLGAWQDEVTR